MTQKVFEGFSFDKKCDVIISASQYIETRYHGGHAFHLYYLSNFFIEVCYDIQQKKVKSLFAFQDTDRLLQYVDSIDLVELSIG